MKRTVCALCPLQKANKGQSRAIERLKKKMFENEFLLLLNSPTIPFRIHNRNGKVRRAGMEQRQFPSSVQGCPLSIATGPDPWESGPQFPRRLPWLQPWAPSPCWWGASALCWPSLALPLLSPGFLGGRPSSQLPFSKPRGTWVQRSFTVGSRIQKCPWPDSGHPTEFSSPFYRATCSYCPQTMRGQSGEKQFRNYRRKVKPCPNYTTLMLFMATMGLLHFQARSCPKSPL